MFSPRLFRSTSSSRQLWALSRTPTWKPMRGSGRLHTRLDTPPISLRHHPFSRIARSDLDSVIATQAREPSTGLIAMPDGFTIAHRVEITSLAARDRLPAVYPYR